MTTGSFCRATSCIIWSNDRWMKVE